MNKDSTFLANISKLYKNKYFALPIYLMEKKTQAITTLIFTLTAIAFFGLIAINPTLSTIVQLRKQLADNKDVDAKLKEKINNLANLNGQYFSIKDAIPLILEVLPNQPNVALFLGQVQTLAGEANVTLSNLQTFEVDLGGTSSPSTTIQSFSFSFTAVGNYKDISAFVAKLINFNRLVGIDDVSLSQNADGTTQLSLRGKAYYEP